MKMYFASTNKSKLRRLQKLFSKISPSVKVEIVPDLVDVEENGKDVLENSLQKVLPYKNKYDCPVIAGDTAVVFDGEDFDPTHVRRVCLKGEDEKNLTQRQIAEKMKDFYINIAKKYGGAKEFYYEDGWAVLFPDGNYKQIKNKREYILTDKLQGDLDIYFPMRCLYLSKASGKNVFEQTEEDYFKEFEPQISALTKLFKVVI